MSDNIEPTEQKYGLRCKVLIKTIGVQDLGKQFDRTVCYLIPDYNSTNGGLFLSAWLPDTEFDAKGEHAYFEIAMLVGTPANSPCRGAISRANKNCKDHHIFVMSKGVEDDLIKYDMNGKNIEVIVLPESAEAVAEQARDSDKSITPYDF